MSYTYQSIDFDDVESVKFNGNDVEALYFNGNKIWEKQQAPLFDTTFGNNSWATIAQISQQIASQNMNSSQIYTTYGWSVGDTKDITLSTNEVIQVRIIGFNHDILSSDHTSKAGITLQMVNLLETQYRMNSSRSNAGGWNASEMRTSTLPTIKATLPSDLQSVIKLVDKKAANGGSSNYTATVTSSDDLFLLSAIEIFTTSQNGVQNSSSEGSTYTYWRTHTQTNDRIKSYYTEGTLKPWWWWLRSCSSYNIKYYGIIAENGNISNTTYANKASGGVALAFCV